MTECLSTSLEPDQKKVYALVAAGQLPTNSSRWIAPARGRLTARRPPARKAGGEARQSRRELRGHTLETLGRVQPLAPEAAAAR